MHDARARILALLALLAALLPAAASADAISVKMVTTVPAGQRPRLTITALEAVDKVEVLLNRDDGKMVEETVGALAPGSSRDILLDGTVGKRQYSGRITAVARGEPSASQVSFSTVVSGGVTAVIDKSKVDLGRGRMEILVSIPEGKVEVNLVSATDGATLVEHEQTFADHQTGLPLVVRWPSPPKDAEVGRLDVRVTDPMGAFRSYSLSPWSVYIPHEEVTFATDSAAIAPTEAPKLQASLAKISDALAKHKEMAGIKLYIAGHTDTVGKNKYNLSLSLRRARSIASWFRKNGLRIPIAFEGFGEQALRVATPDNTDEPRNRRADYILAVEDPVLRATDFRPVWKLLK
ncbi:MAG: OmpA family protein [Deltaproteobacteria bacterium]|nr:OmpA family protein [Deltaproteobacteria bacterium]